MGWPRPTRAWVLSSVLMRSPKPEACSCGQQGPAEGVCAVHGADAGAGPGRRGRARGSSPPDRLLPGLLRAMARFILDSSSSGGYGGGGGRRGQCLGGRGGGSRGPQTPAPAGEEPRPRPPAPLPPRPVPTPPSAPPLVHALPLQKNLELCASYHRLSGLPEAEERGWTLPQGTPACRNRCPDRPLPFLTPPTSDCNPSPTLPLPVSSLSPPFSSF